MNNYLHAPVHSDIINLLNPESTSDFVSNNLPCDETESNVSQSHAESPPRWWVVLQPLLLSRKPHLQHGCKHALGLGVAIHQR